MGWWEVDCREQLDCKMMFSDLLGQIATPPVSDVHKSQGKSEKGLRLAKNLNLRFKKKRNLGCGLLPSGFLAFRAHLSHVFSFLFATMRSRKLT